MIPRLLFLGTPVEHAMAALTLQHIASAHFIPYIHNTTPFNTIIVSYLSSLPTHMLSTSLRTPFLALGTPVLFI